jgi:hypothetical protein
VKLIAVLFIRTKINKSTANLCHQTLQEPTKMTCPKPREPLPQDNPNSAIAKLCRCVVAAALCCKCDVAGWVLKSLFTTGVGSLLLVSKWLLGAYLYCLWPGLTPLPTCLPAHSSYNGLPVPLILPAMCGALQNCNRLYTLLKCVAESCSSCQSVCHPLECHVDLVQ